MIYRPNSKKDKRLPAAMLLLALLLTGIPSYGQEAEEQPRKKDSLTKQQIKKVDSLIEEARKANKNIAEKNKITFEQSKLFKAIRERLDEVKLILSRDLDTVKINTEYFAVQDRFDIASEGFADSTNTRLTLANLNISKVIYQEINLQSQRRLELLSNQRETLENTLTSIDSLLNQEVLYKAPEDEADNVSFYANTFVLLTEAKKIHEESNLTISQLNELLAIIALVIYDSENKLNIIEERQQAIWSLKNIGHSSEIQQDTNKTLTASFRLSTKKLGLAIAIFLKNHPNILILFVSIFLALFFYLRMLNKNYTQNLNDDVSVNNYRFLNHPLRCATFLSLIAIQFFYLRMPFVLYGLAWLICIPTLYAFIVQNLEKHKRWWFIALIVTFLFAYIDNLMLEFYVGEVFVTTCLSLMVLALSGYGLFRIPAFQGIKFRFLRVNFAVSIVLQLVAFYGLYIQNFNLSKRMMVAGIFNLVVFIGIMYFMRIVHQVFILSREVYKKSEEERFSLNVKNLNATLPVSVMTVGLALGLYLYLNTFYFFQAKFNPLLIFFTTPRSIGDFTFTFSSVLLFFGIIYVSFLLSRIVSFLLGESYVIQQRLKKTKHQNLSNSLLLFRIGIITTGVLVAFASTGIPIDRLTLIISALGVGIGFGLQTLVNNLVSGLIIAFEKPINVGDVIDISGKIGTMKSIGVRSSKMTTWDGSDVVIPNGDLLNQHLVNWTLSDSRARFELEVGVAYGSDLEAVHKDLTEMLLNKREVLNYPRPLVLFNQFGTSSIDISIKFWILDYASGFSVKSDLIKAIDALFKEKGYEIPFPQQDLYVKALPEKEADKL